MRIVHPPDSDPDASPINALPPAVILLALPMIAVEVGLLAASSGLIGGPDAIGWRVALMQRFGFSSALFDYWLETGRWEASDVLRFVTYPFIHGGFTHLLMALVFLLAMGKLVGEVMGNLAVVLIFFGSAIGGALLYGLVTSTQLALIGGYPAVYGLIGAYTYLAWAGLKATGGPLQEAFKLIFFLMGIQLLFALIYGGHLDWIADVGGFATGFLLSFVVRPGGLKGIRDRMRQR